MKGRLLVCAADAVFEFLLNKEAMLIGSSPDAHLRLEGAGLLPVTLRLLWDARFGTWLAQPEHPLAGLVEHQSEPLRQMQPLDDGDLLTMPGVVLRFERAPEPPLFQGQPVTELALKPGQQLLFGRLDAEAETTSKVSLDPEDGRIARRHLMLHMLKDGGVDSEELTGQRSGQRRSLVVGDRFAISSYKFEFTGHSIRRVGIVGGARVEASGVSVVVDQGKKTILNDVGMSIERCHFVGILGGSGQGKSTLLNAMCGLKTPTRGRVLVGGRPVEEIIRAQGIGFVPQDDIVHPELTVRQAITFSARLRLDPRIPSEAVATLVDTTAGRLGLERHLAQRITQLSGGQRKRVSIATELLAKPSVLFLDEPSSGLDPKTEYDLMSLLRELASSDCTVICTTHVLGRAYLFDTILFIHAGRLIFTGDYTEALARFQCKHGPEDIYLSVIGGEKTGEQWHAEYESLRGPLTPLPYLPEKPLAGTETGPVKIPAWRRYLSSLLVLIQRQSALTLSTMQNLLVLSVQPLFIGVLVGLVSDNPVLRHFLCVVATLWFGCSNGAQQIVREAKILARERVSGLGLNPYLQSKYLYLGIITVIQAIVLWLTTLTSAGLMHDGWASNRKDPKHDNLTFSKRMSDYRSYLADLLTDKDAQVGTAAEVEGFTAEGAEAAPTNAEAKSASTNNGVVHKADDFSISSLARASAFFDVEANVRDATETDLDKPITTAEARQKIREVFLESIGWRMLALAGAAVVGVAIGLLISALMPTETLAVMLVPLVLIPQLLLGGFVVIRPDMTKGVRRLSQWMPSYSAQRIMDVGCLYGQRTPNITNRTKVPAFLARDGTKEKVIWFLDDEEKQQGFDKFARHNVAWQNLLVLPSIVGQHEIEPDLSAGPGAERDTVKVARIDVLLPKNTSFTMTSPAHASLGWLMGWLVACYAATLALLSKKQN